MPSIKADIEDKHSRTLTNRQMTFAKYIVEGIYSNAECARKSGYKSELAADVPAAGAAAGGAGLVAVLGAGDVALLPAAAPPPLFAVVSNLSATFSKRTIKLVRSLDPNFFAAGAAIFILI